MWALAFDWTIRADSLIVVLAFGGTLWRVGTWFRDEIKDHRRILGYEDKPKGPSGLILKVERLRDDLSEHDELLIAAGIAAPERRGYGRRRSDGAGGDANDEG